jgi:hypothetical protein
MGTCGMGHPSIIPTFLNHCVYNGFQDGKMLFIFLTFHLLHYVLFSPYSHLRMRGQHLVSHLFSHSFNYCYPVCSTERASEIQCKCISHVTKFTCSASSSVNC